MLSDPPPICIAGMHRCGTSLVASLLAKAGVNLGTANELLPPNNSNALGYFEHQDIVYEINEALLESLGGSWKNPPDLADDWLTLPAVADIKNKAAKVCESLNDGRPWGWKDPRTSLVIPFWQTLLTEIKYIICLRNPLDVAASLAKRDQISTKQASRLWEKYCSSALADTSNDQIVVFYDDFFTHPRLQIEQLLDFANIDIQQNISALTKSVHTRLRHHTSSILDLEQSDLELSCINRYKEIYAEFGLTQRVTNKKPNSDHAAITVPRTGSRGSTLEIETESQKLIFPVVKNPEVSIIIPTFNNAELLESTLLSVLLYTDPIYELIVVNDASSDGTISLLESLVNVKVHHNDENRDFLASANIGASLAVSKRILFLNNDVSVRDGWLRHMMDAFDQDKRNKAVGAKLISMDGSLQEAGAIIWPDASVSLYGAGEDPFAPEYNFTRPVDYCSGACLLVEKNTFDSLGGFDTRFSPAYYEDADLCQAINSAGNRVIYQPKAEVFHHHMASRPDEKVRQLVKQNKKVFLDKWHDKLCKFPEGNEPSSKLYLASNRTCKNRLLVILNSLDALSQQDSVELLQSIENLVRSGIAVSIIPIDPGLRQRHVIANLQMLGVEVFYELLFDMEKFLIARKACYDYLYYGQEPIHPHTKMQLDKFHPTAQVLDGDELNHINAAPPSNR